MPDSLATTFGCAASARNPAVHDGDGSPVTSAASRSTQPTTRATRPPAAARASISGVSPGSLTVCTRTVAVTPLAGSFGGQVRHREVPQQRREFRVAGQPGLVVSGQIPEVVVRIDHGQRHHGS